MARRPSPSFQPPEGSIVLRDLVFLKDKYAGYLYSENSRRPSTYKDTRSATEKLEEIHALLQHVPLTFYMGADEGRTSTRRVQIRIQATFTEEILHKIRGIVSGEKFGF